MSDPRWTVEVDNLGGYQVRMPQPGRRSHLVEVVPKSDLIRYQEALEEIAAYNGKVARPKSMAKLARSVLSGEKETPVKTPVNEEARITVKAVYEHKERRWILVEAPRPTPEQADSGYELSFPVPRLRLPGESP